MLEIIKSKTVSISCKRFASKTNILFVRAMDFHNPIVVLNYLNSNLELSLRKSILKMKPVAFQYHFDWIISKFPRFSFFDKRKSSQENSPTVETMCRHLSYVSLGTFGFRWNNILLLPTPPGLSARGTGSCIMHARLVHA